MKSNTFRYIFLIYGIYLTLALAYALTIPLWEAPDEPAHFLYAAHLADTGALPPRVPPQQGSFWMYGFVTSGYEWHQLPLAYGLMASILIANQWVEVAAPVDAFPQINPAFPGEGIPLFVDVPFQFSEAHLLRLLGVLMGCGTLLAIYQLARTLFPHAKEIGILAAGFTSLIPQFVFLQAYITNDTLSILLSSLGLLALVYVAMAEPHQTRRRWVWAGVILSMAISTKLTTWFLGLLAALLAIMMLADRRYPRLNLLKDLLVFSSVTAILPLVLWSFSPDLLERILSSTQSSNIKPDHLSLQHFLERVFPILHTSFWGMFGWVNIPILQPLLWFLDTLFVVGISAAIVYLIKYWSDLSTGQKRSILLLVIAFAIVVVQFIGFNLSNFQGQGRFLYPAIAAISLFVALGWVYMAQQRRWLVFAILLAMLMVNLTAYITTIIATYGG